MAYGSSTYRKNYSRPYRRSRFGARNYIARPYAKKATRRTRYVKRPTFAMAGYVKDTEKKYSDVNMLSIAWLPQVIEYEATPGDQYTKQVQGVKFMSSMRPTNTVNTSQNLVSYVAPGASAFNRVGNKINGKWLDLGITIEAAKSPVDQSGEQVNVEGTITVSQFYMKTNYRIVIVKDLQVNNSTNTCSWADVFGSGVTGAEGGFGNGAFGASDKLDIKNMGRFIIVKDIRCNVDAVNPLKNINIGCYPGPIRFNGGESPALTNKGYYLLVAQDVLGDAKSLAYVIPGNVRCASRLTFTDE